MVKSCFLTAILLILSCVLWAQVEELPELNPEEIQDNWVRKVYEELQSSQVGFRFNSRFRLQEDDNYAWYALQGQSKDLRLNLNVSSRNHRQDYFNFQLRHGKDTSRLQDVCIGSFNPSWGMGAVLKRNRDRTAIFGLGNAGNPDYVNPLGGGLILGSEKFKAVLFTAQQRRPAKLNYKSIVTLYRLKDTQQRYSTERLAAIGLEAKLKSFGAGVLAYTQSYEHGFSDPNLKRELNAFSMAAKYDYKNFRAAGEYALVAGDPAFKTEISFIVSPLRQKISYNVFNYIQLPAYAARSGVLSNLGNRREIAWDMDFPLADNLDCSLRNCISGRIEGLGKPAWLSRNILYLSHHAHGTQSSLQLSRYDKELIAYADSSYQSTLPVHYRCKLKLNHSLNEAFSIGFNFRYHYEDKLKTKNNSFHWENSVAWKHKKLETEAGIRSWQSLHSIAIPDDVMGDEEGVYLANSDDNQVFLKLSMRWITFHVNAELRQSWLDGYRSIFLNIGF